jgi:hypothetical protein
VKCRDCGSHAVDLSPGEFLHTIDVRHVPAELSDDELEIVEREALAHAAAAIHMHVEQQRHRRDAARGPR